MRHLLIFAVVAGALATASAQEPDVPNVPTGRLKPGVYNGFIVVRAIPHKPPEQYGSNLTRQDVKRLLERRRALVEESAIVRKWNSNRRQQASDHLDDRFGMEFDRNGNQLAPADRNRELEWLNALEIALQVSEVRVKRLASEIRSIETRILEGR